MEYEGSPMSAQSDDLTERNSDSEETKQEMTFEDAESQDLHEAIFESYLCTNTSHLTWSPSALDVLSNAGLLKKYEERKRELKDDRTEEELQDHYGFFIAASEKDHAAILQGGLHSAMSTISILGPGKSGVYLHLHADLCIRNYAHLNPKEREMQLIVFKYFEGKKTQSVPIPASCATKDPSPGFDSVVTSLKPLVTDKLDTQVERSQIYLYELDEFNYPNCRPRHCVPHAVVTYTKDTVATNTTQNSGESSELRGTDRFANYPGLKDIIKGINARPSLKKPNQMSGGPKAETLDSASQNGSKMDNPKLREVVDKVNSRKDIVPKHKNWQSPDQRGKPPYIHNQGPRGQHWGQTPQQWRPQGPLRQPHPAGIQGKQFGPGNVPQGQQQRNMQPRMQGHPMNMGFNPGNPRFTGPNNGPRMMGNNMNVPNNFQGSTGMMNNPPRFQNQQPNRFSLLNACGNERGGNMGGGPGGFW